MPPKPKLNPDEILKSEFNYIATTAFQANEDRSRVTSFYVVSVGSLVAAILSAQFAKTNLKEVSLAFFLLFSVLTGLGGLTIAQLARLRTAWHESVQAMNVIKDFYIKNHKEIEPAFKWRMSSIPNTDKPYSIANLIAVEVALVGALTSAAALYFLLLALGKVEWWGWALVAIWSVISYALLWLWYKSRLVDDR